MHRTRSITVRIPWGSSTGKRCVWPAKARQGLTAPSETSSKLRPPDKVFTRDGDDLHVTVPVSLRTDLEDTINVLTLMRQCVKVPAGTLMVVPRVRGRGVPKRGGTAGDRWSQSVMVPSNLDAAASSALRTYAQAEKESGFNFVLWVGNA